LTAKKVTIILARGLEAGEKLVLPGDLQEKVNPPAAA
jgi:phosphate starvation-inducible protein PhoH